MQNVHEHYGIFPGAAGLLAIRPAPGRSALNAARAAALSVGTPATASVDARIHAVEAKRLELERARLEVEEHRLASEVLSTKIALRRADEMASSLAELQADGDARRARNAAQAARQVEVLEEASSARTAAAATLVEAAAARAAAVAVLAAATPAPAVQAMNATSIAPDDSAPGPLAGLSGSSPSSPTATASELPIRSKAKKPKAPAPAYLRPTAAALARRGSKVESGGEVPRFQ